MTYRDDRDADQARIAALEAELAAANSKIDRLEGKHSQALVLASTTALAAPDASPAAARWFGAPTRIELARKFDGAFPIDKLEDLVDTIREHTRDRGRVELLRSSLAWWASTAMSERGIGPFTNVTVSIKENVTSLVVSDRLGQLAGAIFGGVGGGVGGGLSILPILASTAVPVLAPVIVIGYLGGMLGVTRKIFKRSAKKRAIALQQLFDVLAAEIEKTLRA